MPSSKTLSSKSYTSEEKGQHCIIKEICQMITPKLMQGILSYDVVDWDIIWWYSSLYSTRVLVQFKSTVTSLLYNLYCTDSKYWCTIGVKFCPLIIITQQQDSTEHSAAAGVLSVVYCGVPAVPVLL